MQTLVRLITGKPAQLNSILSTFNKVVSDLEALKEYNTEEIEKKNKEIEVLTLENSVLSEESTKADRIKQKLEAIVE